MHALCFPGESPEVDEEAAAGESDGGGGDGSEGGGSGTTISRPETDAEFWDRLTTCHDEAGPGRYHSPRQRTPFQGFAGFTVRVDNVAGSHSVAWGHGPRVP